LPETVTLLRRGRRAREIGAVFFTQPQRTLFSLVCHHRPAVGAALHKHIVNFVSEDVASALPSLLLLLLLGLERKG